eukprot:TRINITY_DN65843_c0_g1_i1.p1 TRINITY_DN65843_c0_g1~~TRINITY_DN65843_c0_g1_i1.p1  ORF type:complete len:287 (-),score=16.46 TRINITY_DN65843_c0_g1_i1:82-864(-)
MKFPAAAGDVSDYSRDEEKLAWVTTLYGERLTGYDFATAIRKEWKDHGLQAFSVCEVLRGCDGVGLADVFLSHLQLESLQSTLDSMDGYLFGPDPNIVRFFVDYVSLRQCQSDFSLPGVMETIETIGTTLMCLHSDAQSYFKRSFCVFEVFATVAGHGRLMAFVKADVGFVREMHDSMEEDVDVLKAQTRDPADKQAIDAYIASVGAQTVNNEVARARRHAMSDAVQRVLNQSLHLNHQAEQLKALAAARRRKICTCSIA